MRKLFMLLALISNLCILTPITAQNLPSFGAAANYGLLSGADIISQENITVFGKIGASNSIANSLFASEGLFSNNSGDVLIAIADLNSAVSFCSTQNGQIIPNLLDGQSLTPNVYEINGNATLNNNLILTGNAQSKYIFNINGNLMINVNATVDFADINASQIIWNVTGSVNMVGECYFPGIILSQSNITVSVNNKSHCSMLAIDTLLILNSVGNYSDQFFYSANFLSNPTTPCTNTNPTNVCEYVINGDFEFINPAIATPFPTGLNRLNISCPWDKPGSPAGTSDYFHPLSTDNLSKAPTQFTTNTGSTVASTQASLAGQFAYAGFYAGGPSDNREYIQQEFKQQLTFSQEYYIEFYVSLRDDARFSVNSLGLALSQNQIMQPSYLGLFNVTPQIQNNANTQLVDRVGWMRVSGCHISDGTEKFLTIGNFNNNSTTNTVDYGSGFARSGAYYFCDSVSITPININAGPNTTIPCLTEHTFSASTCLEKYRGINGTQYSWTSTPAGFIKPGTEDMLNATTEPLLNNTSGPINYIFTLTVTTPDGCSTVSDNVTITVPICCQTSISTTVQNDCGNSGQGSVSTAINNAALPYSILWSNGQTSQNLIGLNSGVYAVTVTDANGCITTTSATVNNSFTPEILIRGQRSDCIEEGIADWSYEIINFDPNSTYTWTITPTQPNGVNVTVGGQSMDLGFAGGGGPPNLPALITVTAIDQNGCQSEGYFTLQECCTTDVVGDLFTIPDITSGDFESQYNSLASDPSVFEDAPTNNRVYTFNGIFELTGDFTFKNWGLYDGIGIYFAPGAKIVTNNHTLTIDASIFAAGCEQMWEGIEINEGGNVVFVNGPTIYDAQYGIKALTDSKYSFSGNGINGFGNCYIGINIPGPHKLPGNIYNVGIGAGNGTTFSTQLLPSYPFQNPVPGPVTYACVQAKNVVRLRVSNSGMGASNAGISTTNCNVEVRNTNFRDVKANAFYNSIIDGIAIHSTSDKNTGSFRTDVYGNGTGINIFPNFLRCDAGIFTDNVRSFVLANKMEDVGTGISLHNLNGFSNYSFIRSNFFDCHDFGVLIRNVPNANISISNNNFVIGNDLQGVLAGAIDAQNARLPVNLSILDNTIDLEWARYGIKLSGVQRTLTQNNVVYMNKFINSRGLEVLDSRNNNFNCNTIDGGSSDADFHSKTGAYISMTSNNTIACNSFDYTRFGINFLNANNNTNFEGNEMNNHYIGSLFTHSAIIGVQNDKGNTWTRANYPSSWGAFHTEFAKLNPNFLVAILNRIETSSVQLYTPSNNGNNVGGFGINWFNSSLQTPFACSIDFNCTAPPSMLVDTTNHDEIFDKKIAEEYIDSIPYDEQSNWLLDYLLYSNLKKNKEYKNNNPILQFFYDSLQTENIGIINNVHELVELAFTPDSATAAQERIHIQALDALLDSLALTDSLLYHANAADSLLLLNEKTSLINQIDSVNAHLQSLAEIINLHKQNYLNMALLENENIQEGLLFENNEKVVNELYINAVRENDFDFTAEKQLIIDLISYLCPFAGGPAVYRARELQAWYNYVQYDDDSICIASGINPRLMNEENNVQNVQVQVYPNPANNLLNIVFDAEPGSEYTFVLYDLLGKEIMHKSLIGSLTEIKLNEVKAGVYNYQILNNKKPIQTDKLIIIH